ncbi:MAG: MFS transporter [Solirubrobacterales bacterium]|nr:MFS transporter [Solirubrobacterales bacterium]
MSVTLREPARPSRIRKSPRAHWYVVATVCIGAFMCQLDASIVTLALPRLGRDLHATVGGVEWVALAYLLVLIATVATVGHLADAFGRKLLYTFGFGVFTLASVACGLAPDLPVLIAARVVQALGAAMLQANSVALIAEAMPRRVLPRALGVQGTAQALGLALGPAFGGLLLALAGWRLIFLINVPAGVLGLAAGWILLPRSRSRREIGGGDVGGALLLAAAAGGTLAYLSLATRYGFDNAVLLALLMAGVVAGALFLVHERRHAHPLIELSMLRRPALSIGLSSSLLAYTVLFVTLFVVSYFLSADRVTPALAGLELALLPVGIGVAAPIAGRLASRIGAGPLTSGGLTLAGAGMLVVALGHGTASLLVGLVVTGLGLGTFNPANNASIMVAAPGGYTGLVGGILNMTRGAGTALGVAGASVIYTMAVGVSGADAATAGLAAASHGLTVSLLVFGAIALATGAALALRGSRASARLGGSSAATDERRSRPRSPTAPLTNEAARGR